MLATGPEFQNCPPNIDSWEGPHADKHIKEEKLKEDSHQQASFLRWINPFSNHSTNTNQTQSKEEERALGDSKRNCEEYRGVQGLKNFWNSRISAIREARQKSATLGDRFSKSYSLDSSLTPSKSIGCLAIESNQSQTECIDSNNSNQHSVIDNFYKYKTAASKKRSSLESINDIIVCDPSEIHRIQEQRRIKVIPQKQHSFNCVSFPAVASTPSGAKIHWATREDIIRLKKAKKSEANQQNNAKSFVQDRKQTLERKSQLEREQSVSDQKRSSPQKGVTDIDKIKSENTESFLSHSHKLCRDNNHTEMAIKSSEEEDTIALKSTPPTPTSAGYHMTKATDKTDSSRSQNGSTNSLSSDSPIRKTNSATRKCSFKTRNYHHPTPRKMAGSSSGSKVAALTHRFNQLIQQDAAILEEVKKNNGILLSYGGHVYKVKREGSDAVRKKALVKRSSAGNDDIKSTNSSLDSSRLSSGKRKSNQAKNQIILDALSGHSGAVKAVIEHFETKADKNVNVSSPLRESSTNQDCDVALDAKKDSALNKPKVPTKSEQVLLRSKEIAIRNSQKKFVLNTSKTKVEVQEDTGITVLEEIKEEKSPVVEFKEFKPTEQDDVKEAEPKVEEGTTSEVFDTKPEPQTEQLDIDSHDQDIVETPSKKSKYARLYEKLRFRSPFGKKLPKSEQHPTKVEAEKCAENGQTQLIVEAINYATVAQNVQTVEPIQPEQKIIDALETVNRRIEHLSKSTNNLSEEIEEDSNSDDMTPNVQPNNSFLFRMNSKNIFNSIAAIPEHHLQDEEELIEAVNSRLINKTHSMDEILLSNNNHNDSNNTSCNSSLSKVRQVSLDRSYPDIFKQTDELLEKFKQSQQEEEDWYEPMSPQNVNMGQESFLYKSKTSLHDTSQSEEMVTSIEETENIYQTVEETITSRSLCNKDNVSVKSYESYDEVCERPEPPPPRKSEPDIRTTIDDGQQPPLPVPKRNIPRIEIVDAMNIPPPPRPAKSPCLNRTTSNDRPKLPDIPQACSSSHNPSDAVEALNYHVQHSHIHNHHENIYDDENIYDTIKNGEASSHCYESISSKNAQKSLDSMSIASNCYESISSIRRMPNLKHSDSISTLSSEQKTNSLYGMTLGQSSTPPNEGVSDNSDEWVDISDGEDDPNQKHQFIVVRERAKCHRSPDWSKRVRDQRIHQQCVDMFDDDSDHYYEPIYTKEYMEKHITPTATTNKALISPAHNQNIPINPHEVNRTPQLIISDHNYTPDGDGYSDEFDSFDTDDDTDEDVKKHDSGVDIRNSRLPDPPTSTNQVYAFVKKIKNLGSLSKSLSKISNRKSSTSKSPETLNKSYENTQLDAGTEYQSTSPTDANKSQKSSKLKTPKNSKKLIKSSNIQSDDLPETPSIHTPRLIIIPTQSPDTNPSPLSTTSVHSSSDKNLADTSASATELNARKKSKTYKSFKSKIRKSLGGPDTNLNIGGTLNGTRSTFYISDSVDVDSGIFEKNPPSDPNLSQSGNSDSQPQISEPDKSATTARKAKKSLSSPELNRRKTMTGVRPSNPPPPPPDMKKGDKKRTSTTSWYAECGVFKANSNNEELVVKDGRQERSSNTSWYAEAGLYQTSVASVASSSGSSGVSTGGECGPGDDNSHSMFLNEPLYQIYSAAKLESISRDIEDHESTDGYEEISSCGQRSENRERKPSRPSALQLVGPKQGPSRTLWSEIPEVINSEILCTLTPTEKRLQEAKFEILTSEASYLKSLNLLKSHFMNHPAFRDTQILSYHERKALFSYIVPVQECSDRLLCDLESVWQNNIMLLGLSNSIHKHAEKYFHVYVSFCEHQGKMDRTLRKLKETNTVFNQTLEQLETDPVCCGLNLHSFLMLPMQRITRLPLLIDAVFSKVKPDDDEYESWKITLAILNKIVVQCNEAANRCEQAYEIEKISRQIEFPSNIRALAIAPVGILAPGRPPRSLVRKGELVHIIPRSEDAKLTFGKKLVKSNVYAFLFSDLFVLTKRKSDEVYSVLDYCPRSMLTVSMEDDMPQPSAVREILQSVKNILYITILENHEAKNVRMIVSCSSISEQQRWLQATSPPEPENPDEKIYEHWDCPQVMTKHEFVATEPDLLSLEPGDIVNVTRKMPDGWYQGERIRDGATGWFPGNYTEEINSQHVRARNLRQRNRLLALTASYVESQKKNYTNKT